MKSEKIKLQVRVDRATMAKAETIFEAIGIDSAVAVRMFFHRVVATKGIPFSMKVDEREFTPTQEKRILDAWEESKQPANLEGPFESAEALMRDLRRPRSRRKKAPAGANP